MKRIKSLLLLPALLLSASLLYAHAHLESSTPADGAVMKQAPAAFALAFSEEVQLLKLEIKGATGTIVSTGFMPVAEATKTFSIPLQGLAAGAYDVSWTIMGKDGHRVEGTMAFTLDPNATESAGAEHHGDHGQH